MVRLERTLFNLSSTWIISFRDFSPHFWSVTRARAFRFLSCPQFLALELYDEPVSVLSAKSEAKPSSTNGSRVRHSAAVGELACLSYGGLKHARSVCTTTLDGIASVPYHRSVRFRDDNLRHDHRVSFGYGLVPIRFARVKRKYAR